MIRRTFAAEPRILSATERTAQYVASNETLDCCREIVRAAGWDFSRFAKNAPFVDSHDYSSVAKLLGNVTGWEVKGRDLVESVRFVPEGASPLADFAWKMTETGFLRAVSVGFMPIRVRSRWRDQKDFEDAVREMKLNAEQAASVNAIHWDQSQTELSCVLIGANPDAVARAHKSGAVMDEDLAKLGFGDDDMTFLHDSAALFAPEHKGNAALAASRRDVRRALAAITARALNLSQNHDSKTPPANQPREAAAGETHRATLKRIADSLRAFGTPAPGAAEVAGH